MCSLVMSPFSCDLIKKANTQLRHLQCLINKYMCAVLHSAWFLDGRTSILVSIVCLIQSVC